MRPFSLSVLALLLGLCAGCQTGEVKMVLPLADGTSINFPLREGPPQAQAEGYIVLRALLLPTSEQHQCYYTFELGTRQQPAIQRIVIEDMSDEKPVTLIDDQNPKFDHGIWHAESAKLDSTDPLLKWVFQVTPSLRTYKFTLTAKDGHKISMYQITPYPVPIKASLRHEWGEKY